MNNIAVGVASICNIMEGSTVVFERDKDNEIYNEKTTRFHKINTRTWDYSGIK